MKKFLLVLVFIPGILTAGENSFSAKLAFSTAAYADSDFAAEKIALLKRGADVEIVDYKEGFFGVMIEGQIAYITESHIKNTKEFRTYKTDLFSNKRKKSRRINLEPENSPVNNYREIAAIK